jgi:beta-galactosidase
MDLLAGSGIGVDLATPTAAPPSWLAHEHPETLPVDGEGRRIAFGARLHYCPSSPVYRHYAARITGRLAERYAAHPALAMWHVANEYVGFGCHIVVADSDGIVAVPLRKTRTIAAKLAQIAESERSLRAQAKQTPA